MNLGKVLKSTGKSIFKFADKNSHIISGCAAIAGVAVTAVLAYKSYPKVNHIIEDQKEKMDELNEVVNFPEEELKRCRREITVETCKSLAPVLAPAIVSGIATCSLMGFSIISGNKKIAAATSLAALYETANREILNKTKELVGEEKAEEIRQDVLKEEVKNKFCDISEEEMEQIIMQADGGDTWFYDPNIGRPFKSDVETIQRACMSLTKRLISGQEPYIDYNDFQSAIGLPQTMFGSLVAWGGTSPAREIEPNLNNTIRIGEKAMIILDWYTRPTSQYRNR